MPEISLEHARAVHEQMLIIDGHNDSPVERVHRGENPLGWFTEDRTYHTDIPRMQAAGYTAGFFIVGDGPTANVWVTIERLLQQLEQHPETLQLVRSAKDIERARRQRKIGILMTIEGAWRWLNGQSDTLRVLYRLGVRGLGLTHGEGGSASEFLQATPSPFGFCSAADREYERKHAGGLTAFGRDSIRLSAELGIVNDLAHANDRAFYDAIELSTVPMTMTHTGAFALSPHWRCLTDDQIKTLAAAGGVMGIAFAPAFIHPSQPTIDRIAGHVGYVADLVGIDHVAIGTDFDGLGDATPVIPEVSQLVRLTQSMLKYGLTPDEIKKVWGGNFLRLLQQTIH